MEEATKSIESLAKHILPVKAHYLSLSATRRYKPHPDEKRLDEQDIRPLQYSTFLSDADRGVLLTRAYFDVREDQITTNNATNPTPLRVDPSKPKKKVSLKDYKNRKIEGESPSKPDPQPSKLGTVKEIEKEKKIEKEKVVEKRIEKEKEKEKEKKERELFKKPPNPVAKEMDSRRDVKKSVSDARREAHRLPSPSPDRRKRVADAEENARPVKRSKVESKAENTTPNATSARASKDVITQKKTLAKDSSKSLPVTNGKRTTSITNNRGASPKPAPQVNGSHRNTTSSQGTQKKTGGSTPNSRSLPPLLSPTLAANVSALVKDDTKSSRIGLKKKPVETSSLKPPPRKLRDDGDPSPSPTKKRKIPPLLSPTLPPIVMQELAKVEKKPLSKGSSQRSRQVSDSPTSVKKAFKPSKRGDTIYVEHKKVQPERYLVTMKYKKRMSKTIERLLALPPGGKKKSEALKRDGRPIRGSSDSVVPGTARKRPRTVTDASESIKRPRTSENLRPSTPPRQSAAMSRIASSSSQAGTPGMANNLTPAAQPLPEQRRLSLNPEQMQKLRSLQGGHRLYMELGTKLKHERDAIMKTHDANRERERQVAMAAGIQSVLSYMHAVKLQSDGFDLERQPRRLQSWKEVLALFRVVRLDCNINGQLTALLFRIQGICLVYLGRAMWHHLHDLEIAREAVNNSKEQVEVWRLAANARKRLGVYDGSSDSTDGGSVGKLIDRLGPWSSPDEAIPIALEILRKVIRIGGPWKPAEELARIGNSTTNGIRS
ncbi:hypothetical protein F5X99DRAFT_129969 [Biscogniauxia marginata]|nr:hypothetical protein F5X99DRAFT_129969 [Biscogniauxia marginata]